MNLTEICSDRDRCRIKVVGVGGAAGNSMQRLTANAFRHLSWAFVDTDLRMVDALKIEEKNVIGRNITRGLSSGGDWNIGQTIAEAETEKLETIVSEVDLLFIIAGLGGGTGSCIAPKLAELAAKAGSLVIVLAPLPFSFEGGHRRKQAEKSLGLLRKWCHGVIPLPNEIAIQQLSPDATVLDTFTYCDEWIRRTLESLTTMLFDKGLVAVDLATLKKVLSSRGGKTLFGLSYAEGPLLENQIMENLLQCPLLHLPQFSQKADNLIVHLHGGKDFSMKQANRIIDSLSKKFCNKDHTFLSMSMDESMEHKLRLFVIGTTNIQSLSRVTDTSVLQSNSIFENTSSPPPITKRIKRQEKSLSSFKRVFGVNVSKDNKHLQGELKLEKDDVKRGYFKGTEHNLYNGVDLDIPTFLRKGIRVKLQ